MRYGTMWRTDSCRSGPPRSFGEQFRGIAGFRKLLVHGYLEIDLDLLARMLSERLDDFEEFASHVEHWLAGQAEA